MIYLFYGPDDFARTAAIRALKAAIPPDIADLNCAILEGRTTRLPELRTACQAYPMLHDHRLVVVHDALKHARSSEMRDGLRALAQNVPDTTKLVFNEADTPDQRMGLIKDLGKLQQSGQAEIREFKALEGVALHKWVAEQAHAAGVALRNDAAQQLIDFVGSDSWQLHNEIAKLAAFANYSGTLSPDAVQQLVSDETEANMFAFIDSLCGRRGGSAVQGVHKLLADGAAPLYILAMIARQVRLMLLVSSAGRMPADRLAQAMGQKPFVVKKALEQARNFSFNELQAFHAAVVEIDHQIKTGRTDAEGALTALVGRFGYSARSAR